MRRVLFCLCLFLGLLLTGSCSNDNPGFGAGVDDDDDSSNDDDSADDDDTAVGDDDDAAEIGAMCWTTYIQDGVAESWGAYWVWTEYFDEYGFPIRTVFDEGGDGPDQITDFFWTETGLLKEIHEDSDADGETDVEWLHTYSDEGLHIESLQVTEGVPEWRQSMEWDSQDRLVLEAMDQDLDEVVDSSRSHVYEGDARSPSQIFDDHDGDGVIDLLTSYLYSELGPPTRVEEDEGADGTFERAWIYTLDEFGREIQIDHDEDGDDDIELSLMVEYDAGGARSYQWEDQDADGVIEQVWRWDNTYDDQGRRTTSVHDYGDDGVIDGQENWIYECVR